MTQSQVVSDTSKLAIVVAGGPAPGINSVIGAATIRARLSGVDVLGIQEGFHYLMSGDTSHTVPLTIEDTSRIHFRGGSCIGISRANPTRRPEHLQSVLDGLCALGVGMLITIGGDDTAFTAYRLARAAAGSLRVVHVPKTIDNDLDLPHDVWTFGYQTARGVGVDIVHNLMVDARTTGRWYFVVAMGRKPDTWRSESGKPRVRRSPSFRRSSGGAAFSSRPWWTPSPAPSSSGWRPASWIGSRRLRE
jgi:6-phosphofructokinase 1